MVPLAPCERSDEHDRPPPHGLRATAATTSCARSRPALAVMRSATAPSAGRSRPRCASISIRRSTRTTAHPAPATNTNRSTEAKGYSYFRRLFGDLSAGCHCRRPSFLARSYTSKGVPDRQRAAAVSTRLQPAATFARRTSSSASDHGLPSFRSGPDLSGGPNMRPSRTGGEGGPGSPLMASPAAKLTAPGYRRGHRAPESSQRPCRPNHKGPAASGV